MLSLSTQSRFSSIVASSIGNVASSRLSEGARGIVQGVYDAAINIFFPNGLVSVVPEVVQRGPFNVTLPNLGPLELSSFGIRVGDEVSVKDQTLKISDRLLILFGSAKIFSPKQEFTLSMLADSEIEANIEFMRKTVLIFGDMAGLGGLLALTLPRRAEAPAESLNIFASSALYRIVKLEKAFQKAEKDALKCAVNELIGLGPGLTPSSDDMLAGLVLICVLYTKNRGCLLPANQLVAAATLEVSRGHTTMLSEEFLMQAALGRGNEPIMRLCAALLTEGRESVERETRRVLAIGATSGTDMVLGIILGTLLCMGKRLNMMKEEYE